MKQLRSTFLLRNPSKVVLMVLLLLAIVLPSSTLAQSDPEANNKQIFLPLLSGGQPTDQTVQAATATELFISEYIEGSSFNKAIEIYNGTGAGINLTSGGYTLELYTNGAATASQTVALSGNIANGDVYVLAHASADPAILAQTDLTSSAVINFNGDDAVVLRKNGAIVDVFGQIGFDPGTEWGSGLASSVDNTIRRKSTICAGDVNGADAFDPALEWDGFANNTFDGLGTHTASCGGPTDTPPTVSSTTPANGATGVASNSDIVVTFSESVDVIAGAISVECPSGSQVASNNAENDVTSVTINPGSDLPANTNCAITINASGVTDNDGTADALTGATNFGFTTAAPPAITLISVIQGTGITATAGTFTVEAIVVGDYQTQGSGQLRGFFIQEEDTDVDSNPATSEGIFIFCSACPTAVSVGDKVRVTGASSEFFGMSQLSASSAASVAVLTSGNQLPTAATVQLPVPGVPSGDLAAATAAIDAYFEPLEGMLVTFPDTLSVSEYFELARYGQVILNEGGRPRQFTDANAPSTAGFINHQIDLATRTIILDDTDNRQNRPVDTPNTAYYYPVLGLSIGNFFRGGDTITNLTGVLHWSFAGQTGTDAWRIRPVPEAFSYAFTPVNLRPATLNVTGSLKVASFNVLNYFLTLDTTSSTSTGACGASATLDCRGADSAQELDRQRAKLTQALLGLDADIVGMIELENTPNVSPQQQIIDDLNAIAGAGTYAFVDTGVIGTDAIRVGMIYKPSKVTPVGVPITDTNPIHNRPPLAQTFAQGTARFTVVLNHFKSKGCDGAAGANLDQADGQSCFNAQRVQQAQALVDFINTTVIPTAGDPDVLLIGDLNSYAQEDPITTLKNAGFVDMVNFFGGSEAYSYVFDGQLGYLDHALVSASLKPQTTGVADWHINADENPLFDYNDDVRDTGESTFEEESDTYPLYAADPFRTSDHDPVLIGLNLDGTVPVAAPTQSPVANGAGWNNSDVTVTWNWSDSGVGIDAANCTTSSTSSGEGELTLTATCSDQAGNTGSASYTVKVDKVAPTVTVTGVSNGANYVYGSVPSASCNTQDATSGVASAATISLTGGNIDGLGTITATCSSATDNAGNNSAPVSVSYTVLPPGTVVESCGGYTIYRNGSNYIVPRWTGAILVGTNSNNTLNGGNGPDLILGLGGNDLINGNGGDDVICGGNGVDLIFGLNGNDFLDGGEGNDVLNGGSGDYDQLIAGAGNDTLLDGDGVLTAQGGTGNDLFTIALRNGWRNNSGQATFTGLAAGYGNDTVGLVILGSTQFLVNITGDERDTPPSSQEGKSDLLILTGNINPASTVIKFEQRIIVITAGNEQLPTELDGAEYLSEPVGEDGSSVGAQRRTFLPLVTK